MALTSQISRAAHVEKPPTGAQAIDREAVAPRVDDDDRRSLAVGLCSVAIRHKCNVNEPEQGDPCTNRNHARDLETARKALILAGLAHDPYPSVERERRMSQDVKPAPQERRLKVAAEPRPDTSWLDAAECRNGDLGLFFGEPGEKAPEREARERRAVKVCARCPVRGDCLDYAVARSERHGVWGGMGEEPRAGERRRRQRRALKVAS